MKIEDAVFEIYDDNVAAELIAHTRHVQSITPEGLAAAAMKDVDPDFHTKLTIGKIMVAGRNFGCNSSREWAPNALMYAGVRLIIAQSFSRIFFRNAINVGLPILECSNIIDLVKAGDELEINLATGEIINKSNDKKGKGTILPDFLLKIMAAGGLLATLETERQSAE